MINDRYYRRYYVLIAIAVIFMSVYIVRLFVLQVVDQSGRERAANNAQLRQTVYPARGLIYDRNGELLVYNQPVYDVTIVPRELKEDFDTLGLCQVLGIDTTDFNRRLRELRDRRGYSRYTPQPLLTLLSAADIAPLQEQLYHFPGVSINSRTLRSYAHACAAHALGSVGEVNNNDIERDDYYSSGDYSGRDGFERVYEKVLRGDKGVRVLMRDSRGRIQGSYHNGELDQPARAGQNLTSTLDVNLQLLAEELLGDHTGSVVALEPATGEVLALVSHPTWDPAVLVGRQRSRNYRALTSDPAKPLLNRATQALYPPGSTFKTVQAAVCLHRGAITPTTMFPCNGPASSPIKCTHHHGSPVVLLQAIEQSCNPYFWYAYRALLEQGGAGKVYRNRCQLFKEHYQQWRDDVMAFGLGAKFADSDIPDMVNGAIPSIPTYDRIYGPTGWHAITIRSNSIGQGEVLLTPLQLANQAATIANEGYYITPHLLRADTMLRHRHETGVSPEHMRLVKEGMHRVMTNGTGRWHNIDSIQICGKTGTAQNSHGKDHAIFIGFAPMDNPKIAVAVVVENAGFGATWGCPIAVEMMDQYLCGYHELEKEDEDAE